MFKRYIIFTSLLIIVNSLSACFNYQYRHNFEIKKIHIHILNKKIKSDDSFQLTDVNSFCKDDDIYIWFYFDLFYYQHDSSEIKYHDPGLGLNGSWEKLSNLQFNYISNFDTTSLINNLVMIDTTIKYNINALNNNFCNERYNKIEFPFKDMKDFIIKFNNCDKNNIIGNNLSHKGILFKLDYKFQDKDEGRFTFIMNYNNGTSIEESIDFNVLDSINCPH